MKKIITTALCFTLTTIFLLNVHAEGNVQVVFTGAPESISVNDTPKTILENIKVEIDGKEATLSCDNYATNDAYCSVVIDHEPNDLQARASMYELVYDDQYDDYYQYSDIYNNTFEENKTYCLELYISTNGGGIEEKVDFTVNGTEKFTDKTIGLCAAPASLDLEESGDGCYFIVTQTYDLSKKPEPTPTAEPTTNTSSSTTTSGYDDGSPYTYDDCGSVYDRWGNMIYEGHACTTYSLVRTSVID